MKKYRGIVILVNLLLVLAFFCKSVYEKEAIIADGDLILLELAPVDPRSLMQGDYMELNYAISNTNFKDTIPKRGFCVVTLDKNGVGNKVRFQAKKEPLNPDEYLIEYTSRKWRGVNIGAESFFFQEGEAEKYEKAKYGAVKVNKKGNSLLVGLYDENRNFIK